MAFEKINAVIAKTKFWDKCRDKQLNSRQLKVLAKVFNRGAENFVGGINTKKYMSIAKTSKASAVRDLNQLLEYGCIGQLEETLDTK